MKLNAYIEQTLLKPDAQEKDYFMLCQESKQNSFFGVCVPSSWVSFVHSQDPGFPGSYSIVTVTGFPHGNSSTYSKCKEAEKSILDGADEIDMVIAIGRLKSRDWKYVQSDISEVVQAVSSNKVKVIIETALLTDEEKRVACQIIMEAGAHFVKTSTGFGGGGAKIEDIMLLKECIGNSNLQIKASGGVKTKDFAIQLIQAGASRIGTSAGVDLLK